MRNNLEEPVPVGQNITVVWTEFISVGKIARGPSLGVLIATEASTHT